MKTRKLGYSDLELTTVGLGTWAMGGPWQFGWGPTAVDAILQSIEEAVNWIDTAPIYGCGHSEELVGKALRQTRRKKPIIATKCGLLWNEKREKVSCLKADSIRRECEQSLKRLGIDVIDLYQIHHNSPAEDIPQAWEQIARLIDEGKVRYGGVSNFTVEQIEQAHKIHPVASSQPPYSMIRRDVEAEHLPFCKANNIGVVVYSPMQMGLLTGKFSQQRLASLPLDDQRRRKPYFQEPHFSINLELVEKLRPVAQRNNITLAQLALAWTLRRPVLTSAIAGARTPEQIAETAKASDVELDAATIEEIEELLAERKKKIEAVS